MSASRRTLGQSGPEMSVIGPGSMRMSDLYGPADDAESVATLHAAIYAGVNLIDTGDFYGSGANEMLIGRALRNRRREDVVVSVKFGSRRSPDGAFQSAPYDVSPAAVKDRLTYSLRRLGTDYLDIHRPARLNPQIPIEETVGALKEMRQASHIRHTGLSEVGAETIRRAADQRSADRVLTAVPRTGEGDPSHPAGAGHRHDGVRRPVTRHAERALVGLAAVGRWRLPRPLTPVPGREPGGEPESRRGARPGGAATERDNRSGGDRLGGGPGFGHHPAGGCPAPGSSDGVAGGGLLAPARPDAAGDRSDSACTPRPCASTSAAPSPSVPASAAAGERYLSP